VKLTDYGAATKIPIPGTEDQRSAALALRAQHGDYDEGIIATWTIYYECCTNFHTQISSLNSLLATVYS